MAEATSNLPDLAGNPDAVELAVVAGYGSGYSPYRGAFSHLTRHWEAINAEYFGGLLPPVHLGFAPVPPRSLGAELRTRTPHGSPWHVAVDEAVLTRGGRVINPWPARGTVRYAEDGLLRVAVELAARAEANDPEGVADHSADAAAYCNRVGAALGLRPVVDRNRDGGRLPTWRQWPHGVRPRGYYAPDVRLDLSGPTPGRGGRGDPTAIFMHLLMLHDTGSARLGRLLEGLAAGMPEGARASRRVELGAADADGHTLPPSAREVAPVWVTWWGNTPALIARHVAETRQWFGLLVLHDALIEAGCSNQYLLDHLRQPQPHLPCCWALRAVLQAATDAGVGMG